MSLRFFSTEALDKACLDEEPLGEASLDRPQARLDGPEAHHLIHVMRLSVGEEILLFDGSGVECRARIERLGRSDVELALLSREIVDRELPFSLTLAVALPKGDRQKWLVEKAVELGVTRLVPLMTKRSVARPVGKALERLRRAVIEASKQCGRNRLMEIAEPVQCSELFGQVVAPSIALLAHPGTADDSATPATLAPRLTPGADVVVVVGPEGGLTDEEVDAALAAGWQPLDLGSRILRIETAALAIAAQLASLASSRDG